jgi:fatty acid CoA ligase FadD22
MRRTAAALAALGLRPAHRVLTALPDGIDVVWSLLGTWYLGAVAVMANPRLPRAELADAANRSAPVLVVCESALSGASTGCGRSTRQG